MRKSKILITLSALILFFSVGKNVKADTNLYDGDGYELDASIYWYGKGDVCKKAVEGSINPYYNPNKPTLILFDGWQRNSTTESIRITFNPNNHDKSYNVNDNLADYWIDKGWNVGMFYWNQFSDELLPDFSEGKIWTNSTSKGLRWRKADGKYVDYEGPEKSVTEIFLNVYSKVMKGYNGSEVRLAGHSVANELAITSANAIEEAVEAGKISDKLKPARVALLDPYWTNGAKNFLNGKWTGQMCREYVQKLKTKGIVFEQYKSSSINDMYVGDSNEEMKKLTIFTDIYPDFLNFTNQGSKHGYAKEWYLYSQAFEDTKEYYDNKVTNGNVPSAALSTDKLRKFNDCGYYWTQRDGRKTFTIQDDSFNKVKW